MKGDALRSRVFWRRTRSADGNDPPPPGSGYQGQVMSLQERLRDVRGALRNLPRAARLVWEAHRVFTVGIALIALVSAALPAAPPN
jgi:hypothetical protein